MYVVHVYVWGTVVCIPYLLWIYITKLDDFWLQYHKKETEPETETEAETETERERETGRETESETETETEVEVVEEAESETRTETLKMHAQRQTHLPTHSLNPHTSTPPFHRQLLRYEANIILWHKTSG